MRFFNEDDKRFEWMLGILALIVVFYYSSYYVIRETNSTRDEKDGCSISAGCELVELPMSVYYIYYPLVRADQYIDPKMGFHFY